MSDHWSQITSFQISNHERKLFSFVNINGRKNNPPTPNRTQESIIIDEENPKTYSYLLDARWPSIKLTDDFAGQHPIGYPMDKSQMTSTGQRTLDPKKRKPATEPDRKMMNGFKQFDRKPIITVNKWPQPITLYLTTSTFSYLQTTARQLPHTSFKKLTGRKHQNQFNSSDFYNL